MGRLRTIQACPAVRRTAKLEIPSASAEGVAYTIEVSMVQGVVTCTCPGFRYRGTCSHTQLLEEKCGWTEGAEGAEQQTREQRAEAKCPRCGSPTIEVVAPDAAPAEDDSEAALRAKGVRVPAPPRDGRG